jgi:hypothetical protein
MRPLNIDGMKILKWILEKLDGDMGWIHLTEKMNLQVS